jgi:BirA family transcriptional regulator, biotin operon repressor / biotin---[acetyl-CoA-carboxylase] ligase
MWLWQEVQEVPRGVKNKRPSRYGSALKSLESCGSTNDEARRWATAGAPDGAVVTALHQTKGRGRAGRVWHSPMGGGLYFSLVVRPKLPPSQAPRLSLVVGLALAEALDELLPLEPRALVKWPNDVFIGGKKVSGVLLELSVKEGLCEFLIVGVGLNVNTEEFPEELQEIATSMALAANTRFDLSEVLWVALRHLETCIDALARGEFSSLLNRWRTRSYTLQRQVMITQPEGNMTGIAVDLDAEGALLIRVESGQVFTIVAGDVGVIR